MSEYLVGRRQQAACSEEPTAARAVAVARVRAGVLEVHSRVARRAFGTSVPFVATN